MRHARHMVPVLHANGSCRDDSHHLAEYPATCEHSPVLKLDVSTMSGVGSGGSGGPGAGAMPGPRPPGAAGGHGSAGPPMRPRHAGLENSIVAAAGWRVCARRGAGYWCIVPMVPRRGRIFSRRVARDVQSQAHGAPLAGPGIKGRGPGCVNGVCAMRSRWKSEFRLLVGCRFVG